MTSKPKRHEIWKVKATNPYTGIEYTRILKYLEGKDGVELWEPIAESNLSAGRYTIEPIERIQEASFPYKGSTALELLRKGATFAGPSSSRMWDHQEWRDEVLHFLSRI